MQWLYTDPERLVVRGAHNGDLAFKKDVTTYERRNDLNGLGANEVQLWPRRCLPPERLRAKILAAQEQSEGVGSAGQF
jgi:hypothetical protein